MSDRDKLLSDSLAHLDRGTWIPIYLQKGKMALDEGDRRGALALFKLVLTLDPQNKVAINLLDKLDNISNNMLDSILIFFNSKELVIDEDYLIVEDHLEIPLQRSGKLVIKDNQYNIIYEKYLPKKMLFRNDIAESISGRSFDQVPGKDLKHIGQASRLDVFLISGKSSARIIIK
jgi:hypothetical protein